MGVVSAGQIAGSLGNLEPHLQTHGTLRSWQDVWVEPYGMIKEAPDEDYACFLTNFGSLLQTAMVGFTGIRVTHPGWAKYPATLPEGWDRLEIDRVWVRGEAKRLVAVNGRPAQLLEAD